MGQNHENYGLAAKGSNENCGCCSAFYVPTKKCDHEETDVTDTTENHVCRYFYPLAFEGFVSEEEPIFYEAESLRKFILSVSGCIIAIPVNHGYNENLKRFLTICEKTGLYTENIKGSYNFYVTDISTKLPLILNTPKRSPLVSFGYFVSAFSRIKRDYIEKTKIKVAEEPLEEADELDLKFTVQEVKDIIKELEETIERSQQQKKRFENLIKGKE